MTNEVARPAGAGRIRLGEADYLGMPSHRHIPQQRQSSMSAGFFKLDLTERRALGSIDPYPAASAWGALVWRRWPSLAMEGPGWRFLFMLPPGLSQRYARSRQRIGEARCVGTRSSVASGASAVRRIRPPGGACRSRGLSCRASGSASHACRQRRSGCLDGWMSGWVSDNHPTLQSSNHPAFRDSWN